MIQLLVILVWIGSLLGLLSPLITPLLLPYSSKLAWLFDLASHWQWLYAILLVLSVLVLARKQKSWLVSGLALILPFLTASPLLPSATQSTQAFKLLSSNLYYENTDLTRLKNLVDQQQPDVIVLSEFTLQHQAQIQAWKDYPHQFLNPARDPFGMAILSRQPLSQTTIIPDANGIEHLSAQLEYQGKAIKVIGFHPVPPMEESFYLTRDRVLQTLTAAHQQPTLIAGDYNATPWSSAFKDLDQRGFYRTLGLSVTWPTAFKRLLGIPIDQVVASAEWKRISASVLPSIGSDHYPIVVELSL
jgi:endonuclease/exonuclease/phosphatase (EEP) superfamily protein YafD